MQGLSFKTKDVVSYAFFPRVVPRVRTVFFSGFGYVAFLMAQIYAVARLLPGNHPYLRSDNIGRFGIQNVVVEAANRLTFSRKNIDQLFVFVVLLAAIVIILLQIIFIFYGLFVAPFVTSAHAFSWFDTPNPTNDLAYSILNDVFGVPDVYCSSFTGTCAANNPPPGRLPFHIALHELFRFYSTALLLIGTLIFLYFVFVIVLETAVTGVPFGQRMQHVWVPIRLVGAVGLLLPVNYGINSGQFIVLYAAKYGSNFATVGWTDFNDAIGTHPQFGGAGALDGNPVGERYSLVAIPQETDITPTLQAMSVVHACAFSYMMLTGRPPSEPAVPYSINDDWTATANFIIKPYLVKHTSPWTSASVTFPAPLDPAIRRDVISAANPTYLQAAGFYYGGDIVIRFGEYRQDAGGNPIYKDYEGYVAPLCGDISIPIIDISNLGGALANGGADYLLREYYDVVLDMWFNDNELKQFARTMVTISGRHREPVALCGNAALSGCGTVGFQTCGAACETRPPDKTFVCRKLEGLPAPVPAAYQNRVNLALQTAWGLYVQSGLNKTMDNTILERGWAGAGIWYNKLAEINGGFVNSVNAIPYLSRFPLVMEQIKEERQKLDVSSFDGAEMFNPSIKAGSGSNPPRLQIDRGDAELDQVGVPLYNVWKWWTADSKFACKEEENAESNILVSLINKVLGTTGISSIRQSNVHVHPLAQLILVGKGLVDNAVRNILGGTLLAFGGGFLGAINNKEAIAIGGLLEVMSSLAEVTALVGLTAGFVLFYVLPFLPFVYFFFAVGSWVKAIFEAMVAVPLWALAHLRIDGDGLPGDAASNGYFLILEIFIRPILTVCGLVASIVIFSTQVRVLNIIWDLVTNNVSGFSDSPILPTLVQEDLRFKGTPLDQFFYTIIYTIICYMMAVASFKLIDKIPDNILRWAGSGVSSFGDIDQDHVENLNRYAATGGMTVGSQAVGAVRSSVGGLGSGLSQIVQGEKGAASS